MALLDDLLSGFSLNTAKAWLRKSFRSYDPSVKLNVALDAKNKNEPVYFKACPPSRVHLQKK
jgi:hypothetical protein